MKSEKGSGCQKLSDNKVEKKGLMQKAMKTLNKKTEKKSGLLSRATREVLSVQDLTEQCEDDFCFADFDVIPSDIEEIDGTGKSIIEDHGLYYVAKDVDSSEMETNMDFLELVESVLK